MLVTKQTYVMDISQYGRSSVERKSNSFGTS